MSGRERIAGLPVGKLIVVKTVEERVDEHERKIADLERQILEILNGHARIAQGRRDA